MPTDIARYSIELFKLGGEGAGIEEILDRHADLAIARSIYRTRVEEYPGRLIMLCDHARCWPAAIAGATIAGRHHGLALGCPKTLRRCRPPDRVLARKYLRSPGPRLFTPCREKMSQGLSMRRHQGSRLQRPSRRRPPLPERNQRSINRLVRLCRYQCLLKRLRPCIDLCGHTAPGASGSRQGSRYEIASRSCSATAAKMWMVSLLACGLSTATNSTPESMRVATKARFRESRLSLAITNRALCLRQASIVSA